MKRLLTHLRACDEARLCDYTMALLAAESPRARRPENVRQHRRAPLRLIGRAWVSKWIRHPCVEWAVIPDVIDGNEAQNDALVDAWEMPPAVSVPVFHMHEDIDRLVRLAERFPRVALGSSGAYATVGTEQWWARMADMMDAICDAEGRPMVKLHGLRMLDPGVFSKLPLSSADSTNVARNVGIDSAWRQSYAPDSRAMRALILMERIERHASAAYWSRDEIQAYQNMRLFG